MNHNYDSMKFKKGAPERFRHICLAIVMALVAFSQLQDRQPAIVLWLIITSQQTSLIRIYCRRYLLSQTGILKIIK